MARSVAPRIFLQTRTKTLKKLSQWLFFSVMINEMGKRSRRPYIFLKNEFMSKNPLYKVDFSFPFSHCLFYCFWSCRCQFDKNMVLFFARSFLMSSLWSQTLQLVQIVPFTLFCKHEPLYDVLTLMHSKLVINFNIFSSNCHSIMFSL